MLAMAIPLPTPWSEHADRSRPTLLAICGTFAVAAAFALLAPGWFWVPLAIAAIAAACILAFRHLVAICVIWLLIAGATLEMTLGDIVGPGAYQTTIAVVKAAELGLALLCIVRYGFYADVFNPGLAFLAMFVAGLAHGLHHDLTPADSLRSLLGSVAPFAFAFSRLSPGWGGAMVRATAWIPLLSVAGGAALDLAGLRPVFIDSGGERLAGLGHPAFLAGFCLAAIYACLIELYREGDSRWMLLLAANVLILVLTGARAPLACAIAVTGLTLGFVRSSTFPRRRRILLLLLAGCLLPLLAALAQELSMVRLFNVLSSEAGNFSGRELLWPPVRAGGRGVALVRLGGRGGQRDHPVGQRAGADDPELGRAQRVPAHVGGGRAAWPRPADRAVRAVGVAAHVPIVPHRQGDHAAGVRCLRGARLYRQRADRDHRLCVFRLCDGGVCAEASSGAAGY
jgi:hypothetical protein